METLEQALEVGKICARYERLKNFLYNRYYYDYDKWEVADAIDARFKTKYAVVHGVELFDVKNLKRVMPLYVKMIYAYKFYNVFGLKAFNNYLRIKN